MSCVDPRALALEVLVRVDNGEASDRALDCALRRGRLDQRDRRLATELVYGTLRRQRSLDRHLTPHARRPWHELEPAVRAALRLGAYQCVHLDSVPDHAAVDSVVEAVKAHSPGRTGLVNGVLRAWLRQGGARASHPASLAERMNVPDWWAARFVERYGEAAAGEWLEHTLRPAPLSLRAHPRVSDPAQLPKALAAEGVTVELGAYCPGALRVVGGNPLTTSTFALGAFSLRGETSQLVTRLLGAGPDDRVLDACAGRGGKAIQCAEDSGAAWVLATDLQPWRAAACRVAAKRARTPEVTALVTDLTQPLPCRVAFQRVLVDAPCSGLGTVRRRPEVKWRARPEDLERLARLQRQILANAAASLAPGGLLLYVTCSTEPAENEQVVEAALEGGLGLRRVPVSLEASMAPELVDEFGYFRTYPHFPELEGFFAAALVREG